MAISKVVFGGNTLVDLTGDSVTAETLMAGETAHNAQGQRIVGTASGGGTVEIVDLVNDKSSALRRIILSDLDPTYSYDFEDGDVWFKYDNRSLRSDIEIYPNILEHVSSDKITLYFNDSTGSNFASALQKIFSMYTIKNKTTGIVGFRKSGTSYYYHGDIVVDNTSLIVYTEDNASTPYIGYQLTKSNNTVTVTKSLVTAISDRNVVGQLDLLVF